jgi:phosphomannomutase
MYGFRPSEGGKRASRRLSTVGLYERPSLGTGGSSDVSLPSMLGSEDWPESLIATHSGLRGRPGLDLTPPVVRRVIRAFVTLLEERGAPTTIGLASDARPGGRALADEAASYAAEAGLDVVDFGKVSTPTAKLATRLRSLGGAVVVTASHLGPEWNGIKFVGPSYLPVDVRDLLLLPESENGATGAVVPDDGAVGLHADALCASVDSELIRAASFRASCEGGVGALGALVLERLGSRSAEGGLDLGLRLDADGDRLELVDERGVTLDTEVVLPLVALATGAESVVKGADTSRMVDEIVGRRGGTVTVVSPGELHLVEELEPSGADLAGEGNGGVVVPEVGPARDALAAGVLVLEHLARTGRPLSELVSELPRFVRLRTTVPCTGVGEAHDALDALAESLGVPGPADPEEGLKVELGDAWALVRRSATEHVLRITVEARHAARAAALERELLAGLRLRPQAV